MIKTAPLPVKEGRGSSLPGVVCWGFQHWSDRSPQADGRKAFAAFKTRCSPWGWGLPRLGGSPQTDGKKTLIAFQTRCSPWGWGLPRLGGSPQADGKKAFAAFKTRCFPGKVPGRIAANGRQKDPDRLSNAGNPAAPETPSPESAGNRAARHANKAARAQIPQIPANDTAGGKFAARRARRSKTGAAAGKLFCFAVWKKAPSLTSRFRRSVRPALRRSGRGRPPARNTGRSARRPRGCQSGSAWRSGQRRPSARRRWSPGRPR